MPTYIYKFTDTGETIEVQQAFSDASLTEAVHPGSGQTMPVKKVFTPVGVTFRGGGFYKTDSRGGKSKSSATSTSGSDNGSSSSGSSSSDSSSSGSSDSSSSSSSSSSDKPATPASTSSTASSSSTGNTKSAPKSAD
jgi:predicted nucleic acid-binding Zn ribbon protein